MFARAQSDPSSHTGSGSGRKQKQGWRRERMDPGGGGWDGQQTQSHGLSLADMEGVLDLTSHASHDTAGHMTSHDTAGHMT